MTRDQALQEVVAEMRKMAEKFGYKYPALQLHEWANRIITAISRPADPPSEAVAYISQSQVDALLVCRNDTYNGTVEAWMRPNENVQATVPLYTRPPADAGVVSERRKADYFAGWRAAAEWADRPDLISDEGSAAYKKQRDAALKD